MASDQSLSQQDLFHMFLGSGQPSSGSVASGQSGRGQLSSDSLLHMLAHGSSSPSQAGSDQTYGNIPANPNVAAAPTSLNGLQSYAQQAVAQAFPDDPNAWQSFYNVVNRESGWNPNALNKGSGAAGLGQFLPSTAQEYVGTPSLSSLDPNAQVDATIKYIQKRYGTPSQAWGSETSRGWY